MLDDGALGPQPGEALVRLQLGEHGPHQHPEVGRLELNCQTLVDPDQAHHLMVYTAAPGSESHEKLEMLAVIGAQSLSATPAGGVGRQPGGRP